MFIPLDETSDFLKKARKLMNNLETLQQNATLIEAALNAQLDTFFLFEIDTGKALYWNEQFKKVTGYTDEEIALLKAPDSYFCSDDVQKASGAIMRFQKDGGGSVELKLVCKDGSTVPFEYYASVIRDEHNKPKYIISIGRNITERKKADSVLHKTRFSIEHSTDQIFWIDSEGHFIDINAAATNSLGYTKEELMTMGIRDIVTGYQEDYEKIWPQRWNAIKERKNITFESKHLSKDKQVIPVEITANYTEYEDQGLMCVIARDITERKRSQEAFRESEAMYRTFFENFCDPMLMLHEGRFFDCNAATVALLGYDSKEELIDSPPWILSPEYQSDGKKSEDKAKEMIRIALTQGAHRFEWDHQRKDGTLLPVEVSLTPIPFEGKNILLTVWRDISNKRKIEEERQKLQDQLLQSQKMEAIGRLAGGVAHDFNNMLTAICGHTEMLLFQTDSSQPIYSDLQEIYKASKRSAELVRQLLAFARKQSANPIVIDLNENISMSLKMLDRLIGEDIKLDWNPGKDLWLVKVDPSQIDQILTNLIINARDAIKDVGTIIIETGNITFNEVNTSVHSYVEPGEYAFVSVSDNGQGIDTETLENIFEPFFTTKELGRGTGLGLSTVYGIVKQNDGFINVYSELTYGTTFKLYFPRHIARKGKPKTKSTTISMPHGNETILLVEDEPATLNVTLKMLQLLGYKVLTASTPEEAFKSAKDHAGEIQLVLTDVIMPEMNGHDLAKKLNAMYPHFQFVFMSGYTADVIAHHGILNENIHFIQKPISIEDFAKKIRETLDN